MKIDLCGGKYTLKSDAYCMWIAENRIAEKTGTEYEENVSGYHPNLESLISGLIRKRILLSEAETLEELKRDIDDVTRDLTDSVSEIKGFFASASVGSGKRKKCSQA
jgi:hypothetical protein